MVQTYVVPTLDYFLDRIIHVRYLNFLVIDVKIPVCFWLKGLLAVIILSCKKNYSKIGSIAVETSEKVMTKTGKKLIWFLGFKLAVGILFDTKVDIFLAILKIQVTLLFFNCYCLTIAFESSGFVKDNTLKRQLKLRHGLICSKISSSVNKLNLTIAPKRQLWVRHTQIASISSHQSCFTDFSWNHLIFY